jgi:S-adenosylmethionine:tRNA ribosyltransferase-isomerase
MSSMPAGKRQSGDPVLTCRAMRRTDFSYELPPGLVARVPCDVRSSSRLLLLDPVHDQMQDTRFSVFPDLLDAGDLVVLNDTRVIPARLHGIKDSGGKVEVLVERVLEDGMVLAQMRASKPPRAGGRLLLDGTLDVEVCGRDGDLYRLQFPTDNDVLAMLEAHGHMPLPPYIDRVDTGMDRERYQTIYAQHPGAVAAPTAGLHFDQQVLERLSSMGVRTAFVTLHVGAGTFTPVRVDDLDQHRMHHESFEVSAETSELVNRTRREGKRVVAVGTTVVRTLEAAACAGELQPCAGDTALFITPGYRFRVVDALLTNFHLPESTLLMLVCAFAGYQRTMNAYRHAIAAGYRFFSYGDAMFVSARGGV